MQYVLCTVLYCLVYSVHCVIAPAVRTPLVSMAVHMCSRTSHVHFCRRTFRSEDLFLKVAGQSLIALYREPSTHRCHISAVLICRAAQKRHFYSPVLLFHMNCH